MRRVSNKKEGGKNNLKKFETKSLRFGPII